MTSITGYLDSWLGRVGDAIVPPEIHLLVLGSRPSGALKPRDVTDRDKEPFQMSSLPCRFLAWLAE